VSRPSALISWYNVDLEIPSNLAASVMGYKNLASEIVGDLLISVLFTNP
jgi:hypothetical protein